MFTFIYSLYFAQIILIFYSIEFSYGLSKYDKKDMENLREDVRQMFQHAYDGYLKYAYPYDELRPLSCDGVDTWGSYSLTLIDALDTLAVMGNFTEFQRVVDIVTANANFDANINVSVFETNIRIIGGLISAHLLSHRAGVAVEPGWPCNGPLLQLAEDVARRLIAAFDTTTGMPYGTVNLRHGVPEGETTVTCTAGAGTFILEFGTLSRLTGDPLFEEVAMRSLDALHHHRSPIGLVGNHIDVATGRWTAQDAGIGAGVDSYYEYLAKGSILLQRPELMHMFEQGKAAIEKYLKRDDWHLWVSMSKGQVTLPVFQSLEAYWPGVLSLIGDVNKGMKSLHNYHQVWKQYGFTPEFYYIPQGEVGMNRESYPLRPELIESVMYLYRATGDPFLLDVGRDILRSIQHSAKTPCGYATIKDVRDHRKEDRMESFFLAETTKYLYLLFDPDNFIHNRGQAATIVQTPWGECVLETGGYIFNTEAHPIDPAALHCCSGPRPVDIQATLRRPPASDRRGVPLATHRRLVDPLPPPVTPPPSTPPPLLTPPSPLPPPSRPSPDVVSNLPPPQPPPGHMPPRPDMQANSQLLQQLHKKLSTTEGKFAHLLSENDPRVNKPTMDEYLEKLIVDLDGEIKVVPIEAPAVDSKSDKDIPTGNNAKPKEDYVMVVESVNIIGDLSTESDTDIPAGTPHVKLEIDDIEYGDLQNIIKDELYKLSVAQVGLEDSETSSRDIFEGTVKELPKGKDEEIVVRDRSYAEKEKAVIRKDNKVSSRVRPASDNRLDYRADDSDRVYPVGGQSIVREEQGECSDSWAWHRNVDALPEFVKQYLLAASRHKPRFDPQDLFQRLQRDAKYARNASWASTYKILSCAAQPFVQRLALSGEMFDIA